MLHIQADLIEYQDAYNIRNDLDGLYRSILEFPALKSICIAFSGNFDDDRSDFFALTFRASTDDEDDEDGDDREDGDSDVDPSEDDPEDRVTTLFCPLTEQFGNKGIQLALNFSD